MHHESLFEKLFDEENTDIIELQPEGGKVVKFEQIAVVNYEDIPYAIMRPLNLPEDQVVVFKLSSEDEESIEIVNDAELANKILEVYHEDVNSDFSENE